MGSVLVGARFTGTRNGISFNSFDATQIDSYPTMKKKASPSGTIWTLLRKLIRTPTHGEMVISTETDFLRRWCICGQSTSTHIVIYYT